MSSATPSLGVSVEGERLPCVGPSAGFEAHGARREPNAPEETRGVSGFFGGPDRASGEAELFRALEGASGVSKTFNSGPSSHASRVSPVRHTSSSSGDWKAPCHERAAACVSSSPVSSLDPAWLSLHGAASKGDTCLFDPSSALHAPGHVGALCPGESTPMQTTSPKAFSSSSLFAPAESSCTDTGPEWAQSEKEGPLVSLLVQKPLSPSEDSGSLLSSSGCPSEPPKDVSDHSPQPAKETGAYRSSSLCSSPASSSPASSSPASSSRASSSPAPSPSSSLSSACSSSSPASSALLPAAASSSSSPGVSVPRNRCLRCLQDHFLSSPSYGGLWGRRSASGVRAARVKCFAMLEALKRHAPSWAEEVVPTAFHGLMSPYAYHSARVFCCPPEDLAAYHELFGQWLAKVALPTSSDSAVRDSDAAGETKPPSNSSRELWVRPSRLAEAERTRRPSSPASSEAEATAGEDARGGRLPDSPCVLSSVQSSGGDEEPRKTRSVDVEQRNGEDAGSEEEERLERARNTEEEGPLAGRADVAWLSGHSGEGGALSDLARRLDAELPVFDGPSISWGARVAGGAAGAPVDDGEATDSLACLESRDSEERGRAEKSSTSRPGLAENGEASRDAWSLTQFQQREVRSRLLCFVQRQSKKKQPEPARVRLRRIHSALVAFLRRYDADSASACLPSSHVAGVGGDSRASDAEAERKQSVAEEEAGGWRAGDFAETRAAGVSPSSSLFFSDSQRLHFSFLRPAILRTFLRTSRLKLLRPDARSARLSGQPLCLDSRLLRACGGGGCFGEAHDAASSARGTREGGSSGGELKKRRPRLDLARVLLEEEEEETTAESESGQGNALGEDARGRRGGDRRGVREGRVEREKLRKSHAVCIERSRVWEENLEEALDALDELRHEVEATRAASPSPPTGRQFVLPVECMYPRGSPRRGFLCPLYPCTSAADSVVRLRLPGPGVHLLSPQTSLRSCTSSSAVHPQSSPEPRECADLSSSFSSAPFSVWDPSSSSSSHATPVTPLLSPQDIARTSGLLDREQFHFPFSVPAPLPELDMASKRDSFSRPGQSRCRAPGLSAARRVQTPQRPSEELNAFDLTSAVLFGDPAVSGPVPKRVRRAFSRQT
ncbi:hypothetical protein TGMAS_314220 [Toxoplasma gondii MAS]|uniref:Uncharacterized protein n=1 Tax=Toxoplasma gondii MAS TaxID=943118 RepID=A0A086QYM5_TOXGO|nr:hypothetical protein TGMAS_314220 [Toxoplasma gondii MAS]